MPADTSKDIDFNEIVKQQEERIQELTETIESISATGKVVSIADRRKRSISTADKINLSEKEARYLIDE